MIELVIYQVEMGHLWKIRSVLNHLSISIEVYLIFIDDHWIWRFGADLVAVVLVPRMVLLMDTHHVYRTIAEVEEDLVILNFLKVD